MNCLPRKQNKNILIASLLIASLFTLSTLALAQTTGTDSAGAGAVSLAYSPPIIELTLDPGESFTDIIKLENRATTTQIFYPAVYDFLPTRETGGQEFIPSSESDTTYSLSKWITFPSEPITLRPKEGDARQFTITVPKNALAGGRYAALFFDSKVPEQIDTTGAKIQTRTGPILLVTVTGEVKESLKSVEFTTDKSFYESTPVNIVSRIQNDGTVHLKPIGQVTLKNMFGKVVDNLPVNETLSNILPNSTRKYDLTWKPEGKLLIGKYQAVLNLTYGTDVKKNTIDVVSFWIIPWKLIVIALLSIAILFVLIKLLLKKYNRWVVSKSDGNKPSPDSPVTSSIAPDNTDTTTSIGGEATPTESVESITPEEKK